MDDSGKRKALIIAVSDYDRNSNLKDLPFCENDGIEMKKLLKKLRYKIKNVDGLIGNVDGTLMRESIFGFFADEDINSEDTLLFYFSGHGVPGKNDVFLASSNIDLKSPKVRGFSFADLNEEINNCFAKRIVLILDSCYAGSLKLDSKSGENALAKVAKNEFSSKFKEGEGKCLLASCMGFQESFATKEEDHSFFTNYLLKGLRGISEKSVDENGLVTPESLMNSINYAITNHAGKKSEQRPVTKTEFAGKIILAEYPDKAERKKPKLEFDNDIISHIRKGEILFSQNELSAATLEFNEALKKDPKNQDALNWIGEIMLDERKNAVDHFEKMLKIDGYNVRTINNLGLAYLNSGDRKSAIAKYDQALTLNPNNSLRLPNQFQLAILLTGKSKKIETSVIQSEIVSLRKRIIDARIPPPRDDNFRLLTWNIRRFNEKEYRAIEYIAEICKNFDIIAIQEVLNDLRGLETLQSSLGKHWNFLFSEASDSMYRLAFAYNTNKVQFTGFASGMSRTWGRLETKFDRVPYMVSFRINGCNFILVNTHFPFGSISKRLEEYKQFSQYLKHFIKIDSLGADVIGCGTFNLEPTAIRAEEPIFKKIQKNPNLMYEDLASNGFFIPEKIRNIKTNLDKTKSYQSIGFQRFRDSHMKFNSCGTIDFVGAVYKRDPKLAFKFTDALPLWAEFKTKPNQIAIFLNP